MDNIGGIVSAEYCLIGDISYCSVTRAGIALNFSSGNPWKLFPSTGKIVISVKPTGTGFYEVSGTVRCPDQNFQTEQDKFIHHTTKVIVRITRANGKKEIVGSLENPVRVQTEILTPEKPEDFNGVVYSISGTQTHPQLPQIP